jgi:hypothetical protein
MNPIANFTLTPSFVPLSVPSWSAQCALILTVVATWVGAQNIQVQALESSAVQPPRAIILSGGRLLRHDVVLALRLLFSEVLSLEGGCRREDKTRYN